MKKEYLKYYLIIFLVTIMVGFPLFRLNMLDGHDAAFHLYRLNSLKLAILDKQLVPVVNPYMLGNLGYGANLFYAPLTSVVINIMALFTPSLGLATNLFIFLTLFFSGLFMFKFVLTITNKPLLSLLASLGYIVFPYHLFDIYTRMSLGEIASFVFIPLVFRGIYNIVNHEKDWLDLTLGTAGLFLSHSLSTLLVAIFAFFYTLSFTKKLFKKPVIKLLILSLSLSLVLSLPVLVSLIDTKITSDYMVYDHTYMKTNGMDMESRGINILAKSTDKPVKIARIACIELILLFPFLFIKKDKVYSTIYLLTTLSLILSLNIISWHYLPNIFSMFQYPFRFLQMTSFFLPILICLAWENLITKNKLFILLPLIMFVPGVISNLKLTEERKVLQENYHYDLLLRGDIVRSRGSASSEYLPRQAIYAYDYLKNRNDIEVLKGDAIITNYDKKGSHLTFKVKVNKASLIELPFIYYPGYKVKINQKRIKNYESVHGLLALDLDEGTYEVTTHYEGPIVLFIAYLISFSTFIILIKKHQA